MFGHIRPSRSKKCAKAPFSIDISLMETRPDVLKMRKWVIQLFFMFINNFVLFAQVVHFWSTSHPTQGGFRSGGGGGGSGRLATQPPSHPAAQPPNHPATQPPSHLVT